MIIKIYFRKNLKMSPQKLAAQVGHVAKELGRLAVWTDPKTDVIIVLQASDKKFDEIRDFFSAEEQGTLHYLQVDLGLTEVPAGTETCFGYIDN